MTDDFELLAAWRAGDRSAGSELLERHVPTLHRFFRNKVDADIADLVQRTMEAAVVARDRVPRELSFRVYLLGIARNLLLMFFRKQRNERRALEADARAPARSQSSPSKVIAARQEQRLLLQALRRIPLELQIAVELRYWEDLRLAEIAAITEVPIGTVKSRLARARDALREQMDQLAASPELIDTTMRELESWARSLRDSVSSAGADDD